VILTFQGLFYGWWGKVARREKGVPFIPFALHMSWLLRQVLLMLMVFKGR
jgi:hypothetical protein